MSTQQTPNTPAPITLTFDSRTKTPRSSCHLAHGLALVRIMGEEPIVALVFDPEEAQTLARRLNFHHEIGLPLDTVWQYMRDNRALWSRSYRNPGVNVVIMLSKIDTGVLLVVDVTAHTMLDKDGFPRKMQIERRIPTAALVRIDGLAKVLGASMRLADLVVAEFNSGSTETLDKVLDLVDATWGKRTGSGPLTTNLGNGAHGKRPQQGNGKNDRKAPQAPKIGPAPTPVKAAPVAPKIGPAPVEVAPEAVEAPAVQVETVAPVAVVEVAPGVKVEAPAPAEPTADEAARILTKAAIGVDPGPNRQARKVRPSPEQIEADRKAKAEKSAKKAAEKAEAERTKLGLADVGTVVAGT